MPSTLKRAWAGAGVAAAVVVAACSGSLDVTTDPGRAASGSPSVSGAGSSSGGSAGSAVDMTAQTPQIPFEPVTARIYVPKVKNLMLGLPATEEEIAAVTADPTALKGMVDAWFVKPEAQAKLSNFFSLFSKKVSSLLGVNSSFKHNSI